MILQRNGSGQRQTTHSGAFVGQRPANRSEADRVLALLAKGFRRQHNADIPIARAAIDHRNTAMLRLLKRHLGEHLHKISTSRVSQAPALQSLQTTATHT